MGARSLPGRSVCRRPGVRRFLGRMQLTVRDAARLLGVTEQVLERWVRRGELPAQLVDDRYRFNRVELLEWAAQRKMLVSAEILEEPGLAQRALPPLSQ